MCVSKMITPGNDFLSRKLKMSEQNRRREQLLSMGKMGENAPITRKDPGYVKIGQMADRNSEREQLLSRGKNGGECICTQKHSCVLWKSGRWRTETTIDSWKMADSSGGDG